MLKRSHSRKKMSRPISSLIINFVEPPDFDLKAQQYLSANPTTQVSGNTTLQDSIAETTPIQNLTNRPNKITRQYQLHISLGCMNVVAGESNEHLKTLVA